MVGAWASTNFRFTMDAAQLRAAFLPEIGFRQSPNTYDHTFSADLTQATGGLFYDSVHPDITIDNLIAIMPRFEDMTLGQGVSIEDARNNWLRDKIQDGIIQALTMWLNEKLPKRSAHNLLSVDQLFHTTVNNANVETVGNKIAGYELTAPHSKNIIGPIHEIGLHFDTAGDIVVRLFQSGILDPIQEETFSYSLASEVQWFPLDGWELTGDGSYYIVVDHSTTAANPINGVRSYEYARHGCTHFPTGGYINVIAFEADVPGATQIWDLTKNRYSLDTNYGINLRLSAKCDFTLLIIEQKSLFLELVQLQVALNLLNEIFNNSNGRINRPANWNPNTLYLQMYGDSQGRNNFSVHGRLMKVLKGIEFNARVIDPECLTCDDTGVDMQALGASY